MVVPWQEEHLPLQPQVGKEPPPSAKTSETSSIIIVQNSEANPFHSFSHSIQTLEIISSTEIPDEVGLIIKGKAKDPGGKDDEGISQHLGSHLDDGDHPGGIVQCPQ